MFPQRRMTTDTPDGNYSQALNLFVRGEDGWAQMPSRSISLNDYMKQLIKAHNADIDTEGTPEEFDMTLCEHLFDGPETIEGLLAEHYTLSWALASLRDKLKHYEDTPTSKSSSRSGSMLARTHSRATGTTFYPRHLSARAQPESCTPAAISRRATGLASTCIRSPASRLRPGSTQRPSSSNRAKRPLTCLHRSGAAHRTRSTPAQAWLRAAERPQT